jgi:hypothetical protein
MTKELKIGDPAPDFKATAVGGIYGGGQEVKFADFADSTLVLYFYPEDDTPGCTKQACDLRDSFTCNRQWGRSELRCSPIHYQVLPCDKGGAVGQQKQGCLRDLRRFGYWPVTSTILKRASFRIMRP